MILYIDQGNTATKWLLLSEDGVTHQGAESGVSVVTLTQSLATLGSPLEEVWLSNVAGADAELALKAALADFGRAEWHSAKVREGCLGLSLAYAEPETLGVDRWLAMLSVRAKHPNRRFLYVSAGTAITVDVVSAEGRHEGGLIAPGVSVLGASLFGRTAALPDVSGGGVPANRDSLGTNTEACVHLGAWRMVSSFIESTDRQFGANCSVKIVSGGDAAALSAYFSGAVECVENSVMDGLIVLRSLQC